jgi:hypothetical protein
MLWRDPYILPHHDGLVPRNLVDCLDGGKIIPALILAERPQWNSADIAYYLGYPDDVLYDPQGLLPPLILYAHNRILAAEQMLEELRTERTA